jgi:hypothetical protein
VISMSLGGWADGGANGAMPSIANRAAALSIKPAPARMAVVRAIFDFIEFSIDQVSSGKTALSFIPPQHMGPDAGQQ